MEISSYKRGNQFFCCGNTDRRTTWGPQSRNSSPYSNNNKGKGKTNKVQKFSREVILLRSSSSLVPHGKAKAELQHAGNVLSSFKFSKVWSAAETLAKLKQAFPEFAEDIDEPEYVLLL
jgi:C1A family cysteine protease